LILREKHTEPDPLSEFNKDLDNRLGQWQRQNHEIILLMDANEEIGSQPGGLSQAIARNGIHDILANYHDNEEFPNTYIRGKNRIDYIFGTKRVMENCKSCGILPICYGYPSDHPVVFIRIDL
jgi:hypothetical protein